MSGTIKLLASIAVIVVSGLAILLLFDVISITAFSDGVEKILLLVVIFGLASAAIAFIMGYRR